MRRSVSLLLLLSLSLNGCAHWATMTVPMDVALRPEDGPHHVRLRLRDSSSVELRFAAVDSAEITGRRDWPVQEWIAIPRGSVESMAVQRIHPASFLIPVVALVWLLKAAANSISGSWEDALRGAWR